MKSIFRNFLSFGSNALGFLFLAWNAFYTGASLAHFWDEYGVLWALVALITVVPIPVGFYLYLHDGLDLPVWISITLAIPMLPIWVLQLASVFVGRFQK